MPRREVEAFDVSLWVMVYYDREMTTLGFCDSVRMGYSDH